jgi:DNA-binding transcriptional ArsR family regulator
MTLLNTTFDDPMPLQVRVLASPAIEALVAHWISEAEIEHLDEFLEIERIREVVAASQRSGRTSERDVSRVRAHHGAAWTFLLPFVDGSGATTLGELASHLADVDAEMLGRAYSSQMCDGPCEHGDFDPSGDTAEFKEWLVGLVGDLGAEVDPMVTELGPTLTHDAELTRFLERRMTIPKLVESVTNGIAYTPEANVDEIVLVPSLLLRPFNLMFRFSGTQYFIYPVSDEAIDADDDTPPSWVVSLFKALSDERRLRLLRHLAANPATLMELTEYLGTAKSTTHHHLRTLRAAGLVRHTMDGDKKDEARYEVRTDVFPDAFTFLSTYLDPGAQS